ncbi:MAG: hypothetical protein AAF497_11820 [Planctomycetota bacterium]
MAIPDELDLFHGETTDSYSHIYARWNQPNPDGQLRIVGEIRGPFSDYAQTLPATFRFTDLGAGETVLARATVADPCSWTDRLPSTYKVTIQVESPDNPPIEHEGSVGIRRLGTVQKSFSLDGERWVLRAADFDPSGVSEGALKERLREFRNSLLVCSVRNPGPALLQIATRLGVFILAKSPVGISRDELHRNLITLSRYPCVAAAVVSDWPTEGIDRSRMPNLLLGTDRVDAEHDCDFAYLSDEQAANVAGSKPIVVFRAGEVSDVRELRRQVESLQAKLCPKSLAGYCSVRA